MEWMPLFSNFIAVVIGIYWFFLNDRRGAEGGTTGLFRFEATKAVDPAGAEPVPRSGRRPASRRRA